MAISRREFLKDVGIGVIAAASQVNVHSSPLEALVQSGSPKTFEDYFGNTLEVSEMYSDGMLLTQSANVTDSYNAKIRYFIRNGAKEFSEWSVQCDLYTKSNPVAVNTLRADGTAASGVMEVTTKDTHPTNPTEPDATFTEGQFKQSSMSKMAKLDKKGLEDYFTHFKYYLADFRKGQLKPMPAGYNPLK